MHSHPARDWTLEQLAREAGMSRSVMAERFNAVVGTPPMTYLSRWRMQLAAKLMETGSLPLRAVAESVGYETEASFSRGFKRIVGMSPGQWRRRTRHRQ
ncbi:AraC family transcriptional regulator [Roseibium salinum]|nr:AraC family transcriptional regulator [Roseibium salinum]